MKVPWCRGCDRLLGHSVQQLLFYAWLLAKLCGLTLEFSNARDGTAMTSSI
eukprot:CAMPEP_0170584982 /NCGR_PEP_ID=MMETSP0224-20130122/8966_1 /TAXON_ID=285029 /ORGANISM="Togula jolla, Strain CCCM 725" /LENGTH=50 /DNA_ID=CAMNT_0010908427 /DNA_START=468 /DNA_END=620 /DNA_ORIENTATION=+